MRCPRCGFEWLTGSRACARCSAAISGRIRPATFTDASRPESLFRPDAVLALTGPITDELTASEQRVAGLIDGVRPVARILRRSGSTGGQLRLALAALNDRGLLLLTGIVEQAELDDNADADADETTPRGKPDVISPRVLAEIDAMLDEDAARSESAGLASVDDPTDVLPVPLPELDRDA